MKKARMWLFSPIGTMSDEQQQQWLASCYVASPVDALLADPLRSVVVTTHAGCGLSTSLFLLRQYRLLTFQYDPDQWPGQPDAFTGSSSHFEQWMARVAYAFMEELKASPALHEQLFESHYEFLIWLVRRYLNRRQNNVWHQQLQAGLPAGSWETLSAKIRSGDLEQLYGNTVADIYGQIDECLDVARCLGWEGIYASVDISWADWISRPSDKREQLLDSLKQLLTTLTPLERPGFGMKMGVPELLLSNQDIRALIRGRAVVSSYHWPEPDLIAMAQRYLMASAHLPHEGELPVAQLWHDLRADLVSIWATPGPAAAAVLASIVLSVGQLQSPPAIPELRASLYRQAAKLRLDRDLSQRQVWRGMQAIKLDETPFRFFLHLWQQRGDFVSNDALEDLAGTRQNLDKNISRIRQAIEPLFSEQQYLYVKRNQSSGTWLDKEACLFSERV